MKSSSVMLPFAPLLPLVAVAVLTVFGITFDTWVYLILVLLCPFVAGILWFIYRDAKRKVDQVRRFK